jgi:hypothetical protein
MSISSSLVGFIEKIRFGSKTPLAYYRPTSKAGLFETRRGDERAFAKQSPILSAIRVALTLKYFEPAEVGMPIENPLLLPFRYQRKIVNLLES